MASRSSLVRCAAHRVGAAVLTVLALSATACSLSGSSAGFDRGAAERYAQRLEALRALDSELSAEILKTRSGLIPNYDGLVRIERLTNGMQLSLRDLPAFLDTAQRGLVNGELLAA